ncbi:ATP-binding protein [Leptospira santarosai]|uniref:ATP-binding protein n=1 Tax=Leptospira santarosai TaxID=28183 RepID=UPI0024AEA035|nr:ATP-binding protein [Leptospira santarosai]
MAFVKATKEQSKLRAAIFGPSGSGKTFSCLSMAQGMGTKIAVIDSERGSSAKYSDRFPFDINVLTDRTIEGYIKAMKEAGELGYDVLIIDSGTHAWKELLEEVSKIAKAKYSGNTYVAWNEGTPKQDKLISAIYDYPGHVFFTMRSKTEYVLETTSNGKQAPRKVGLAPNQGKDIEFEFDVLMELDVDHTARITKDRTGKFQDRISEKPGIEFGKEMAAWLSEGLPPKPKPEKSPAEKYRGLVDYLPKIVNATNLNEKAKIDQLVKLLERWDSGKEKFAETEIHFFEDGRIELLSQLGNLGWIEHPTIPEENPNPTLEIEGEHTAAVASEGKD